MQHPTLLVDGIDRETVSACPYGIDGATIEPMGFHCQAMRVDAVDAARPAMWR